MYRNGPTNPEIVELKKPGDDLLTKTVDFVSKLVTNTRPNQADVIAGKIIHSPDYQSLDLSAVMAGVSLGDAGDGRGVRWAAARRGEETTPEGARDDEKTDKEAARKILSAMAIRAFMNRDMKFGAFLTASLALIMGRDTLVTQKRDEAQALDIDIKATGLGKAKTGVQNLTFTTQTNPVARTKYGRRAVYLMQATADVLSAVSGVKTYRRLNKAIKEAKAQRTAGA